MTNPIDIADTASDTAPMLAITARDDPATIFAGMVVGQSGPFFDELVSPCIVLATDPASGRSELRVQASNGRGPVYRVALETATATAIGDAIEAADADHQTRRVRDEQRVRDLAGDQTTP